jgi:GAF domain-containing protein
VEREVPGEGGRCYLARMLPYRTVEDRIAGIVLTFVDFTERFHAERALAEELKAAERLRELSEKLSADTSMTDLFDAILDTAIRLSHADAGTVQLHDPDDNKLHLLVAKGFSKEMTNHFKVVEAGSSTPCGVALSLGRRTFVDFDNKTASDPDGSLKMHLDAGFRSAQSTPLISRSGRVIGMLSTHWREHRGPTEHENRVLDLLARQAADAIDRQQAAEALREHVEELQRFNEAAVGRENRMIELKKEINELAARVGEKSRYSLDFVEDAEREAK